MYFWIQIEVKLFKYKFFKNKSFINSYENKFFITGNLKCKYTKRWLRKKGEKNKNNIKDYQNNI